MTNFVKKRYKTKLIVKLFTVTLLVILVLISIMGCTTKTVLVRPPKHEFVLLEEPQPTLNARVVEVSRVDGTTSESVLINKALFTRFVDQIKVRAKFYEDQIMEYMKDD